MKQVFFLFLLLIAFFTTNCKEDETKQQYSSIGLLKITADSTILESDVDNRILITNGIGSNYENGDRVIIEFTLADGTTPAGIDYLAEVLSIQKVPTDTIIELTSAVNDTIANDPIQVNSMWVGKNFLNLNFSFYGGYKSHFIYLTREEGVIPTDTVNLEIHHNDNEETGTYGYYSFISFDLQSLKNNVADSVILHVKAKEFDNRTFEEYFTYKY